MPRRYLVLRSRIAAVALVVTVGVGLAACTPAPEPDPSADVVSPAPDATTEEPVLLPEGSADDNLPVFTAVTAQVWAASGSSSGRAYVDALVAAGFDKAAMQVTHDLSTVQNPAESMQFSVRWGADKCLVGQVGPSTGDPVTMVMDQLAEGRCLIGTTRTIDW